MNNMLEQLKFMTTIVADTDDIEAIHHRLPQDAATNPSLLLKGATLLEYVPLTGNAVVWAKSQSNDLEQQAHNVVDRLAVDVGAATVSKACKLIGLYNAKVWSVERSFINTYPAGSWGPRGTYRLFDREDQFWRHSLSPEGGKLEAY